MTGALPRAGVTAIPPGPAAQVLTPQLPQTILASTQPVPVPAQAPPPAQPSPLDKALESLLGPGQGRPYNPATDPPF